MRSRSAAGTARRCRGRLRLRGERGVAAAEEDERGGRDGTGLGVPHATDHDLVVAAGQAVLHRALQDGEYAIEPGTASRSVPVPYAVPGRRQPAPGEAGGQVLLPGREHVHYERAVPPDGPERLAAEIEADQDERRIERQRGHRVGGGAYRGAVGTDRRDHCDAGREMPHRVTELRSRDVRARRLAGWRHAQICPWLGGSALLSAACTVPVVMSTGTADL